MKISDLVPDVDVLLGMAPEELGGVIIEVLAHSGSTTIAHIDMELFGHEPAYPTARHREVWLAIAEAWAWLEGQALLIWKDDMNGPNGWRVLSRRGHAIAGRAGMEAYRKASLLPKEILHNRIVDQALVDFQRGDYPSAVFKAFKEVEIATREAAALKPEDVGVPLARKAFDINRGPLTRVTDPVAEREALQHLFAGGLGSYKNPHSHRSVAIDNPVDAIEMIILASHLLRIVDARRSH